MGPAPETGYNFISYTGELNNNPDELIKNHNLLKEIIRVQDFGYSMSLTRTDLTHLGERSLISRPNINNPQIELNFGYIVNGLRNEARMGFNVNYSQFEFPYEGEAFYKKNDQVSLLSGFDSKSLTPTYFTGAGGIWPEVGTLAGGSGALTSKDRFWPPYVHRDRRNIYAVITDGDSGDKDAHQSPLRETFNVDDTVQQIDPLSNSHHLISFGDCYMSRYSVSAQVGGLMNANVAFLAENVEFHSGASGARIPALDLKSGGVFLDSVASGFIARPNPTSSSLTYFKNSQNGNPEYFPPGLYSINYVSGVYDTNKVGVDVRYTNPVEYGYADSIQTDYHTGETKTKYTGVGLVSSGYSSSSVQSQGTFQHGGGRIGIKTEVYNGSDAASEIAYKLTAPQDVTTRMVTPLDFPDEGPVAFQQGDLTLNIPNDASGMGIDFDDSHIQSFSIEIDLNRSSLDGVGRRYPIYRDINYPVFANINFTTLVKDSTTGSLDEILRRGDEYDFSISVKNSCDSLVSTIHADVTGMSNPHNAGRLPLHQDLTSILYEVKKAKLMSSSFTSSIGSFKRGDLNFSVELDPDNLSKGLFISGLLNIEKIEDFFLLEGVSSGADQNGGYVLREGGNAQDKSLLVTNLNPLY